MSGRNIFWGALAIVALLLMMTGVGAIAGIPLLTIGYFCTHNMKNDKK